MIFNSIRWRLQLWYGLILLAVLVGFGVTAYQLESGRQWRRLDGELMRRLNAVSSALRGPNPRARGPGHLNEFDDRPASGERRRFEPLQALDSGQTNHEPPPEDFFPRRRNEFPPEPIPGMEPPAPLSPERFARRIADFRLSPQRMLLFEESNPNGFYYIVWGRDDRILASSTNAPSEVSPPTDAGRRGMQPPRTRDGWREVVMFMPPGERLLVGCSIESEQAELRRVAFKLAGVGGVILALGLAGGLWLATRAIRPIQSITETAKKISGGDLAQRIGMAETESELGQLAGILNATFSRLDAAFRQQQQFTSDAAHELRTPVSVILTQTQSALNRERSGAEYRDTLQACQRSAQRMRRLIESLLALARLDAGQEAMQRSRIDLARVVSDCVEMIRPLATERQIRIEAKLAAVECAGDSDRLAQVMTNLLSNAVHYNRDAGEILVTAGSEGGLAVVTVRDTGIGIAPEHQANVFKRFYRVDTARTMTQGRSGLGLAISKAIVEAHGGTIELESEPGRGTTVTVRLPGLI